MGYGMHDQRPVVTFSTLALCFISMQPERHHTANCSTGRLRLKSDDTRIENRFRLSAKRTSPFKSAGASVQSTTGSRGVRISGSNAGYIMFRGSVKSTGYPLHLPVSPSLPLRESPCVITFQLGQKHEVDHPPPYSSELKKHGTILP